MPGRPRMPGRARGPVAARDGVTPGLVLRSCEYGGRPLPAQDRLGDRHLVRQCPDRCADLPVCRAGPRPRPRRWHRPAGSRRGPPGGSHRPPGGRYRPRGRGHRPPGRGHRPPGRGAGRLHLYQHLARPRFRPRDIDHVEHVDPAVFLGTHRLGHGTFRSSAAAVSRPATANQPPGPLFRARDQSGHRAGAWRPAADGPPGAPGGARCRGGPAAVRALPTSPTGWAPGPAVRWWAGSSAAALPSAAAWRSAAGTALPSEPASCAAYGGMPAVVCVTRQAPGNPPAARPLPGRRWCRARAA